MIKALTYAGLLGGAGLGLAACALGVYSGDNSSLHSDQAEARVQQVATDTVQALAPGVATTVSPKDPLPGTCGEGEGGYTVGWTYDVRLPELPPERRHEILLAAQAYFKKKGYAIIENESNAPLPWVTGETSDRVHVGYYVSSDGSAYVSTSVCLTETPPSFAYHNEVR